MKRIIIIFIIVVYLMSFVEISCLAEEIPKPGEVWSSFLKLDTICGQKISNIVKKIYIRGMGQGMEITSTLGLTYEDNEKIYDQASFIVKHVEEIVEIMDDLYEDPANVHITLGWMCIIACDKLKGEDVEGLIQDARLLGLEVYPFIFPSY